MGTRRWKEPPLMYFSASGLLALGRIGSLLKCWLYSKTMPLWMSLDAQQTNLAILATWQLGKQLK